ncbi:MAG: hypothetical protein MHM6MM_007856, partial [Cercozoa sp. M6MM]
MQRVAARVSRRSLVGNPTFSTQTTHQKLAQDAWISVEPSLFSASTRSHLSAQAVFTVHLFFSERQSRHFAKFRRRDLELGNLDEMSKLAHETRTMHRMKPQPEKERWENFPTFELTEERVAELKKKAAEKPHQVPRLLHW